MKFYSEKGYTGIDIAISIVVITIFISLIAVIISRFNSSADEIKYKEEATAIAIEEIEKIKKEGFETYKDRSIANENSEVSKNIEIEGKEGFHKTILVEDYTDIERNSEKISGLVKKVKVKISYMFQGKEQSVEVSTIISKEN